MRTLKKTFTSMLIVSLMVIAFCGSYCKGYYSYAEDINYMSDEELEAAYQAYLQSKGGGLIGNAGARLAYTNGKMLNFLTSSSNTTPYRNINEIKGLMSWQKAELESGNSSVLQLSMSQGGASVFSLYTQWLLQNHYFGNGVNETDGMFDDGIDNNLYSGRYFVDADGIGCLIYVINNSNFNNIVKYGTTYKYSGDEVVSNVGNGSTNLIFHLTSTQTVNTTPTYCVYTTSGNIYGSTCITFNGSSYVDFRQRNYQFRRNWKNKLDIKTDGDTAIILDSSNNKLYLGLYTKGQEELTTTPYNVESCWPYTEITNGYNSTTETNINFYTNTNNNIAVFPTVEANGTLYITPKVNVGVDGEINYQPYTFSQVFHYLNNNCLQYLL